ncbi:MAG: efflux RND transporter periplasmic adaptor subunit [Gemmatimonadetes bacterium]|nr:efflux RND transporter periplasmic adaptor subunit [Gemmatimonadota bacterium]MDA1103169.1 efflux RND transporter periplasmic adaptor subunit [Gemmatimonadota bacterium]
MSSKRRAIGLPLLIVFGALASAVVLVIMAPETEAVVPERALPNVVTVITVSESVRAAVVVSGIASPAREITLIPEVSGRIVSMSPALVPGGVIKAGDVLVQIDPRNYELAVEQQRGQVRSAELEVELEAARQQNAREEWSILGTGGEPSPLVMREGQRAAAEMNLTSSRSTLARAELDLERTVIRAPFNASVVEESVDVGQVVGPQTTIARLVGTDQLRVTLSVRVEDLALIELPDGEQRGSLVAIRQRLRTGEQVQRTGHVVGLVDRLDPQTRRAEIVVTVDDPLAKSKGLPLLPGSAVEGEIQGRVLESVVRVPRAAVYDGNTVWVVASGQVLEKRTLEAVWADDDALFVRAGLVDGDELVTSPLSSPVEGSRVRVAGDSQ